MYRQVPLGIYRQIWKTGIEGKILPGEIGFGKYRSREKFKFCPIHPLKKVILKPRLLNNGDLSGLTWV